MTKTQDNLEHRTMVAIDVAKVHNDVLIEPPGKKRYRLKITNDRVDHDRLVQHLVDLATPVCACFEATGNYHRPLAWRLLSEGFDVQLISSVAAARTREALHNGCDKNDPKDAQVMLYMLKTGQVQRYYDPLMEKTNDWQELSKTDEVISKAKTEVLHRLQTHYFPLYFPEVDKFRHNSRAAWIFRFLHAFPTPGAIAVLSLDEFTESAWDLVGRKVSKSRIPADIYATAQSLIALLVPLNCTAVMMYRLVIEQMLQLISHRDQIEA